MNLCNQLGCKGLEKTRKRPRGIPWFFPSLFAPMPYRASLHLSHGFRYKSSEFLIFQVCCLLWGEEEKERKGKARRRERGDCRLALGEVSLAVMSNLLMQKRLRRKGEGMNSPVQSGDKSHALQRGFAVQEVGKKRRFAHWEQGEGREQNSPFPFFANRKTKVAVLFFFFNSLNISELHCSDFQLARRLL